MKRVLSAAAALVVVTALPSGALAARGEPQRSGEVPPGLTKALLKGVLDKALVATLGSNSRLQDLPVSP